MCIRIGYKVNSCEKREVRASNSKSMVLRIFHVCVCVLNSLFRPQNKNTHVSFPVGMVTILEWMVIGAFTESIL